MTPRKEAYRTIPLDKGQFTLVSPRDFDWLMQWKWFAQWNEDVQAFYAARSEGPHLRLLMHREILGLTYKDGKVGDHRNLNTLDNRRSNLRLATYSSNNMNTRRRKDNTSGFKGVYFFPERNNWYARVHVNKKMVCLGYFPTKEDAVAARQAAAREYYGEFAREQ